MENDKLKYKIRCSCGMQFTGVTFEPPTVSLDTDDSEFSTVNFENEQQANEILGHVTGNHAKFICPNCQKEITKKRKRIG
ncbi:hypothetical protein ACWN8V_11075 [Vagococcus elongatus]|uniref:Uncharacterized protein n=1 Tax=Vagococcus elongatus TaxID=180344 RepID=A0A430ANQ3_9ENTE|nr:hypothetical protein [Vagococcus elongatus]RSU09695.1 hypothetical protein CBF29_10985 [Vagococcus elongatus]